MNFRCYLMVVFCLNSRDFGICSLARHKHLDSVVVRRSSTLARVALSALSLMIKRIERSLFAQGHVRSISSFFTVRDNPLRFIPLYQIFSAPFSLIHPFFAVTLRQSHDLSYSIVLAAEIFSRWVVVDQNFLFRTFLDGSWYNFEPCLYSKLGNAIIL